MLIILQAMVPAILLAIIPAILLTGKNADNVGGNIAYSEIIGKMLRKNL